MGKKAQQSKASKKVEGDGIQGTERATGSNREGSTSSPAPMRTGPRRVWESVGSGGHSPLMAFVLSIEQEARSAETKRWESQGTEE